MGGSRTVKTLAMLFVAMTLGAMVLMVLETEPVRPVPQSLAVLGPQPTGAAQLVARTQTPMQAARWRYVILHSSRDASEDLARGCHFIVGPDGSGGWRISPTGHWTRQDAGRHAQGFWKDASIGVCLIGDFSRKAPPPGQFDLLVELVNALQEACLVSADRVYLHSDIDSHSASPGPAFPAARLSAKLLRAQ